MSYSEATALEALSDIRDPRTGRDIVSAGMLGDLTFEAGVLRALILIDPALADGFEPVRRAAENTLGALDGVEKATVILTAHKAAPNLKPAKPERKPVPHQARRPEGYQGDSQVTQVLAVSSAKGGVGKSTIAVNLAAALTLQGKLVGLLDADIHGPSAPILLGLKGQRAVTEAQGRRLIKPLEAHGLKVMSIGFLTEDDGPIIWRGPMVQGAISKMLWDVNWGKLDYLIIDMPPGTGDPQLGLAQDIKPKGAIIVSTPQDLALADARKGVRMFEKVNIPIVGLIENMSVYICTECETSHYIFGKDGAKAEAEKLGVTYLGGAPLDIAIRESADLGQPAALKDDKIAEVFSQMAKELIAQS